MLSTTTADRLSTLPIHTAGHYLAQVGLPGNSEQVTIRPAALIEAVRHGDVEGHPLVEVTVWMGGAMVALAMEPDQALIIADGPVILG